MISVLIIVCVLVVLTFLFLASYSLRLGIYVKALCCVRTNVKIVALTFDDGCDVQQTPKILEILRRNGIKATFFLIGDKANANPELVRQIATEGHHIGSHTMHHTAAFTVWSPRRVKADLQETRDVLEAISGTKVELFRPPFGVTNPHIGWAVRQLQLKTIGWSIRSYDTNSRSTRDEVVQRIERQLKPGAIILLHDDRPESDVLLEKLLQMLKEHDYKTILI